MPAWQREYLATCAAVIAFCLGYCLCDYGSWPRLTYFPFERAWAFTERPPGGVPMNYLGTVLWGGASAVLAAAVVLVLARRARGPSPARLLALAGGWAITAFLLAGAYFTWNLRPF